MSRKDRPRVDAEAIADFEQRSRAAAAEALREIDPDITDEEIAKRLANAPPVLIGVRGRRLSRQNIPRAERRTVRADAEGIDRMNRWLPGAAIHGGRTPGTNAVDDAGGDAQIRAIVAELRRNHRKVQLATIATASGAFTRDNLRRWLRENGKRLSDY